MGKDFHLISFFYAISKIISRAITNHFTHILDEVIGEFKRAFVFGCLIIDNFLLGFKSMHWIKQHQSGETVYAGMECKEPLGTR